jgi:hypothetical protein
MSARTDIDIDFFDRDAALSELAHIPAMVVRNGEQTKHASGVYLQDVPVNPFTGICALDYAEAEDRGYFKIDFLNNTLYGGVRDEAHLESLLNAEPDWSLLEYEEVVSQLAHIHRHFGVVRKIKPRCIDDLALVLALMRPAKRHLMTEHRAIIEAKIWENQDDEGYAFKRAHAIAYAASIVVQLNLLCEQTATEIGLS